MDDYALVLNAGSSSLKFCVYRRPAVESWRLGARGQIEGIGTSPRLSVKDAAGEKLADQKLDATVKDGRGAIEALAAWLRSKYGGARVLGVGHRVVHGGARYARPVVVTREILKELYELSPLAPLHQPYNLAAIEAVFERLPDVPQVACFDTGFHRGHAAVAELVPLPREIREAGLQRYGFHGLSYEYIASVLPELAPSIAGARVIVAHLGSGASLCALKEGKSIESTLGFTALDGLCMGTRPGTLDPGVVLYLFQNLGLSAKEVEGILYKKSGLLGISGISNDMRDLLGRSEPEAVLAVDYSLIIINPASRNDRPVLHEDEDPGDALEAVRGPRDQRVHELESAIVEGSSGATLGTKNCSTLRRAIRTDGAAHRLAAVQRLSP